MNRPSPPGRPAQWRSLEQLADTPAFRRFMDAEFPATRDLYVGPDRRAFLKLMAASLSLAGLAACDDASDGRSQEVPFVRDPARAQPGATLHYASSTLVDGIANGILVTTRNGRPLKVEGNPAHPWSRGGTDVFGQASVLDLYDPARSQAVRRLGTTSTWGTFRGLTLGPLAALRAKGGEGFRLLTGPVASPVLRAQIADLQRDMPAMRWHTHAPADRSAVYAATQRVFGRPLETRPRFDRARVVVSLDGDFLDPGPSQVGMAAEWMAARRSSAAGELLTLHAAAAIPNLTAAKADHPLTATPAEIEALGRALLAELSGARPPADAGEGASALDRWRARAAAALHANRGASLVVAGSTAAAAVHEAAHRLNAALGNIDRTVFYTASVQEAGDTLAALVDAMTAGSVAALVMLDTNPAYDAPGALRFSDALSRVGLKIHAGAFEDETALRSDWHLPLAHPLESWGDARSWDGTVGLMQPTIAPLYEGRSASEILSLLADAEPQSGQTLLHRHWQGDRDDAAFAAVWQGYLRDGFIPGSAFAAEAVQPTEPAGAEPATAPAPAPGPDASGLIVLFRADPTVRDGRYADNPWLQELPKPLTKIVWENAISVSPALAERTHLATGDIVALTVGGRTVEGAAWILPGQADGVVGLTLGYGRSVPDRLSSGLGYDAYALRGADDPWSAAGAVLRKTGRTRAFATTQDHNTMEGHDFVRVQRMGEPPVGETASWTQPSLYTPPRKAEGSAWGMVIDLDACIGCNACVVACQAENNIAVVGREQVAIGREMHWLRVDRYYEGETDAPTTHFQPVPCMHCEEAPCEVGCPVEATLHDGEGLNVMVYNRCVGTRTCSGYCPYKVRHFNYLDYAGSVAPSVALQRNPEVTVRARGVMEKCTYCVQRIANARINADRADAAIPDGGVQTACQGACPTRAITFGDLADPGSAVSAARRDGRNYALLGELNTKPRTSYLAKRAPARGRADGTG